MTARADPAISLLLAGSVCLLPFLVPYHQPPVLSFLSEWLAAGLGVAAVLARAARGSAPAAAPPPAALWLIAFALFLACRAATASLAYPQASALAALYVLYAVALIWLGAQLVADAGLERVAIALAAFILAGALANAAAGIIQFYGRPRFLEDVIAELRAEGAYGNIAQRNLYANYLALGQCALLLLWLRARLRTTHAIAALILLATGSALSGSRGALLYPLWYAALGFLAVRVRDCVEARRLRTAACCAAAVTLLAHLALPWLNHALQIGAPGESSFDRLSARLGESPRLEIALLALRAFAGAPIAGVGIGEFAGAAFTLGIDPALSPRGEIWTSPHDLLLQLLAETGAAGAALAFAALGVWVWQAARSYRADPRPALWWILAAMGVELIHSLTEFPLWSAHFLGVAALLLGASSSVRTPAPAASLATRVGAAAICILLSAALAVLLRDYVRLEGARITGTTTTLAPPAQAARDAATMRDLGRGLLAPVAETAIALGAPLDRSGLADKASLYARVVRHWPANGVVVRQAVLLAFDGHAEKARDALERALRTYPGERDATISLLEQARAADPAAIEPLLALSKKPKT